MTQGGALLSIATIFYAITSIFAFQFNNGNNAGNNNMVNRYPIPTSPSPQYSQGYPWTTPSNFAGPELTPVEFIVNEISSHDVVVFSTTYCQHCAETKNLFYSMNIQPRIIELDQMSNGLGPDNSIALTLLEMTGQRTVPNVFIKGFHLGGNDVTQEVARTGELAHFLQQQNNFPL